MPASMPGQQWLRQRVLSAVLYWPVLVLGAITLQNVLVWWLVVGLILGHALLLAFIWYKFVKSNSAPN